MATIPQVSPAETTLVPVFVSQIGGMTAQVCDGRTLHAFLENRDLFANWIKDRVTKYEFIENQDFSIALEITKAKRGGQNRKDYLLSLDMAKELSMVENNAKGREARRYFINMERRALEFAGQMASAPQPAALPAPDPLPVEVRRAINRRANVLAHPTFQHYQEALEQAVRDRLAADPATPDLPALVAALAIPAVATTAPNPALQAVQQELLRREPRWDFLLKCIQVGMSLPQTAAAVGISESQISRDKARLRAFGLLGN